MFVRPPQVYPDLLTLRFPDLIQKSYYKEWKLVRNNESRFLSFEPNTLSEEELEAIEEWKKQFSQYVLLGLNKNIEGAFSNELDFCLALDFYSVDGVPENELTHYANARNQLKFDKEIIFVNMLSNGLSEALEELELMFRINAPVLSIVPSPSDECSVPRKLAKAVSKEINIPFVDHILLCNKQKLRSLPFSAKAAEWDRLYTCQKCIQLLDSVADKTVFLIDELYQSGTTLWSCAKNLKLAGATNVIGLVCVKTSRDTDNQ